MQRNKKAGKRYLAALLAFMMVLNVFSYSLVAQTEPILNEAGFEEVDIHFDPVAALAVQERVSSEADMNFGDLALVLHTIGDPLGPIGFEGNYALPNNSNELVEVIVQFHTPPMEVLRLMNEINHPYMQAQAIGRTRVVMSYEEQALAAHNLFESQLAAIPMPLSGEGGGMTILDTTHTLFNGALMRLPAGMVEVIAALPEVFMVTPNFTVYSSHEDGISFEEYDLEFLAELEEIFTVSEDEDIEEEFLVNALNDECEYICECEHECNYVCECAVDEKEEDSNIITPADPATWMPGSNSWSRGFMREAIELFDIETIWDSGLTGRGVRAIVTDTGLDYFHPRYHPFYVDGLRMTDGTLGSRVPGSGGAAGVAGGGSGVAGPPHHNNTPMETLWASGWGDGDNHGTHCTGSVIGMAPGVYLYAYRALGGNAMWGLVASYGQMWEDGHGVNESGERYKRYTRNIVNVSLGAAPPSTMVASTYATNVLTLTGYYLILVCTHNHGPALYTLATPSDADLALSVGAGRMGGWVSPYIFEDARIGNQDVRIELKTWDWAWMPLDANGWREAFPVEMEDILFGYVFERPTRSFSEMQENQVPRWRRGGGLNLDEFGNAEFVWVGALANTDAARLAAFNRLQELEVDITGKVIIQARNGYGTPGQTNPRDFWAQRGAGALVIVDDRPAQTTFSYSGGAGVFELVQGSIPLLSMPGRDGRASLPFPAGFAPQAVISDSPDGSGSIPVTTNAVTATANITGHIGIINLGTLTDHSVRDEDGNFITQTNRAPNYLATFSSIGPTRTTYSIGVDIVGPGTQIHSTWPAQSTNRWARALRNEDGDFVNAQGEMIHWETGVPVRDPNWFNNPEQRDWSIAYALQMGTSMSTPTVAGIAALVWEAFPDDGPLDIKARLMNTSIRMGSDERGTPYNVFQEGAGFVNPIQAVTQQAFATAQVPMHWHFSPNVDPDLVGQPDGPVIGQNPPGGWQSSLINVTQSALNFGAVVGTTSQELTVTIHNAGSTAWVYNVTFVTADPAVNQRPLGAFHPDVALRSIHNSLYDGTQTITFVMDFPEGVPHGLYNGHVVFTNAAGGRITMPFAGVPYGAEGTVNLRNGSGMMNPIIAGFVREYAEQDDLRHIPSNVIGSLTNSNRSSVLFNIDFPATTPGTNVLNWANRVDFYARRVEADGSLGVNTYYFGTMNLSFSAANTAGMFLARHAVANRVADPSNPGQFINLQEGVYELFIDFNITPPSVVDMQLTPGQAIPLSVGKFVVTNTQPSVVQESITYVEDGIVDVTGHILSWAHDMAIYHNMFHVGGQNAAGNFIIQEPTPVTFAHSSLLVGGQVIRPDAEGRFALNDIAEGTNLTAVDGMLFEYTAATGNAVSLAGALISSPLTVMIPYVLTTSPQDFTSIWETARNSRQWTVRFIVTQTFDDGRYVQFPAEFTIPGANANLSGSYVFEDGPLQGHTAVFDIRNNGRDIRTFNLR